MRDLNILASQASEFKYHRMRTEGKSSGLCKPDLIPLATCAPLVPSTLSPSRRLSNETDSNAENKTQMRRPSPRASPRTSPLRLIPEQVEESAAAPTPRLVIEPPPSQAPKTSDPNAVVKAATIPEPAVHFAENIQQQTPKPTTSTVFTETAATAIVPPTASSNEADSPATKKTVVRSVRSNGAARPTLTRSKGSLLACKPPNVLVYSESTATRDAVIQTLTGLLVPNMYTVYPLSAVDVRSQIWLENTTMLVVCGSVDADIGAILTEFFLRGGKMLSLCSDVLHIVLPAFRTHAEVREHELVQFSYARWQRVRMMHHIFCYQPSPVRKHFSTDSDDAAPSSASGSNSAGGPVSRKP